MERLTLSDEKRKEGYIVDSRAIQRNGMTFYTKLKEYEDLEEQGLLVNLKYKPGDTIWYVDDDDDNYPLEFQITSIEICGSLLLYYAKEKDGYGKIGICREDFEKTIFSTKEEALNALSEIRSLTN